VTIRPSTSSIANGRATLHLVTRRADDLPPAAPAQPDCAASEPRRSIPPCPDGDPQRLVEIVGFRLKGADYLSLRVILRPDDHGICHVVVEEHPDRVLVLAVACIDDRPRRRDAHGGPSSETDCPCNVWLEQPLGDRIVVDIDSGQPLPLCVPGWGRDVPTEYVPRPTGSLWP
jgi:hypothetical protein